MKLKVEGPIKIGENELDIEIVDENISMNDLLEFIKQLKEQ